MKVGGRLILVWGNIVSLLLFVVTTNSKIVTLIVIKGKMECGVKGDFPLGENLQSGGKCVSVMRSSLEGKMFLVY